MLSPINHIRNYIEFLKKQYSLQITVHKHYNLNDDELCIGKYADFNLHTNPYCMYLKINPELWKYCIKSQDDVVENCRKCGSYFGMCHAGVCEYVYPITYLDDIIGFISVSGYRAGEGELLDKAVYKIGKLCNQYNLDQQTVIKMYEKYLTTEVPDKKLVDTLVEPLTDMILLDFIGTCFLRKPDRPPQLAHDSRADLYLAVCNYIRHTHNSKVALQSICRSTNYSASYISHMFKSRSGMTINQYVNDLRINEAKSLLKATGLSVQEIAMQLGYTDANYFSNVFRKSVGVSPRKWRKDGIM